MKFSMSLRITISNYFFWETFLVFRVLLVEEVKKHIFVGFVKAN